jgi:hypothetical protein
VVHGRADHKSCWHFIIEQVNTAFRRIGLIFPLEAEGDNPDWATTWLTGVGMPAAAQIMPRPAPKLLNNDFPLAFCQLRDFGGNCA